MNASCPECRAPLYAGARICGYCGAPVADGRVAPPPNAPTAMTRAGADTPRAIYLALAVAAGFAVAVGGALLGTWLARGTPDGEEARARASNVSTGGGSMNGGAAVNNSLAPQRTPAARPTTATPTRAPSPPSRPSAPSGRYFVLLGSFTEPDGARERLDYVRANGYDARIVDSDDYPNMTPGLTLVVMGPFEKGYAKGLAAELGALVEGAYAKSGW